MNKPNCYGVLDPDTLCGACRFVSACRIAKLASDDERKESEARGDWIQYVVQGQQDIRAVEEHMNRHEHREAEVIAAKIAADMANLIIWIANAK